MVQKTNKRFSENGNREKQIDKRTGHSKKLLVFIVQYSVSSEIVGYLKLPNDLPVPIWVFSQMSSESGAPTIMKYSYLRGKKKHSFTNL